MAQNKSKSKPSALAQLCIILMDRGIRTTKALADETGYSERQIWRARAEIASRSADANVTDADVTMTREALTPTSVTLTQMSVDTDAEVTDTPRAHARIESPSGILITKVAASNTREREIAGLNGSTKKVVENFACLLAGDFGTPDFETAYDLIADNVDVYGAERVKIGFLELRSKIASGERFRDPLRAFNGFVKGAKLPKTGAELASAEAAASLRRLKAIAGDFAVEVSA